jgi:MFS family permease
MRWLGFILHEMAFGLLSVFIPLYIIAIGGTLIHVGVMSSIALFLSIPASYVWGYLCDRGKRYKPYILLSFLSLAIILYLFTLTVNINLLIALYALMFFLHMAHEPPKNVLIAEIYTRKEWEKAFATYEYITEVGWLAGMLIGVYMSIYSFNAISILLTCSILNFLAFLLSLLFVSDPAFIFERSLVRIEKSVLLTYRGTVILSRITDGFHLNVNFETEKANFFCYGFATFSLATQILFTPLPLFFSQKLALQQSVVYALFCINSAGGVLGYFLINAGSHLLLKKSTLHKIAMFRCILTSLLIAVAMEYLPAYNVMLAAAILFLLGLAYAIFHILSLSTFMEIMPEGKAGLYNTIIGFGEALGSFIGSFLAEKFGFAYTFLAASLSFLAAYVIFKIAI